MFTFLPGLLRPSQEGALHLHPIERAPEAFMNRASPVQGGFIGFLCKPRNISLFISPLLSYPSTRDHQSGPLKDLLLGSIKGPLKDPNNRIGEKKNLRIQLYRVTSRFGSTPPALFRTLKQSVLYFVQRFQL